MSSNGPLIDFGNSDDLPETNNDKPEAELERLEAALHNNKNTDAALNIALRAAELSMRSLKVAKDPAAKALLNTKVVSLLNHAEQLKGSISSTQSPSSLNSITLPSFSKPAVKALDAPESTRVQTKTESIIVLKASYLNGHKFVPWRGPPDKSLFDREDGEPLYTDDTEMSLSDEQKEMFSGWQRPQSALPPPSLRSSGQPLTPSMSHTHPPDLVQDAATDCSIVSSLNTSISRQSRGHTNLLRNTIYPWDAARDQPAMSPNGKYIVKLNFNGTVRKVEIDDTLPVSNTARHIHLLDRRNPNLLWPALIEKAYLKFRGGYDFPGSNSATDLWTLTGWIPEQVFVQDKEFDPNALWKRIQNAHKYGDVLVTLGTGVLTEAAEQDIGLSGEHDYAVICLREHDGRRLLQIKNPWSQAPIWKGRVYDPYSRQGDSTEPRHVNIMDMDDDVFVTSKVNMDTSLPTSAIWIDLESVCLYFEYIYLNWNPGLFKHRQDIHFSAPVETHALSFIDSPQCSLSIAQESITWLLLSRHYHSREDNSPEDVQDSGDDTFTLYVFDKIGTRIMSSQGYLTRGPSSDTPQSLLRIDDLRPKELYTVVVAPDRPPLTANTLTLSAFANASIDLELARSQYLQTVTHDGTWDEITAGGNAYSPTYAQNPQYKLEITQPTQVAAVLETPIRDIAIHARVVRGKGRRVATVRARDVVIASGDYKRGGTYAEGTVETGSYTVIVSTFNMGELAPYTLRIMSDVPVTLTQLAREGAGRIRTRLAPATFQIGQQRLAMPLLPKRMTRFKVFATHSSRNAPMSPSIPVSAAASTMIGHAQEMSMVRVTVELGSDPERQILIASSEGEFSNALAGVRTEEIDISPDMARDEVMWLVIERLVVSHDLKEDVFDVDIFYEQPDSLAVGVWRRFDD